MPSNSKPQSQSRNSSSLNELEILEYLPIPKQTRSQGHSVYILNGGRLVDRLARSCGSGLAEDHKYRFHAD